MFVLSGLPIQSPKSGREEGEEARIYHWKRPVVNIPLGEKKDPGTDSVSAPVIVEVENFVHKKFRQTEEVKVLMTEVIKMIEDIPPTPDPLYRDIAVQLMLYKGHVRDPVFLALFGSFISGAEPVEIQGIMEELDVPKRLERSITLLKIGKIKQKVRNWADTYTTLEELCIENLKAGSATEFNHTPELPEFKGGTFSREQCSSDKGDERSDQSQCSESVEETGEPGSKDTCEPQMTISMVIEGYKTYCCQLCRYKTKYSTSMRRHLLSHTGQKPFKCTSCSFSCSRADQLKTHMFTHNGIKPFNCTICSFSCIQAGDLKRHMFTHNGIKPFNCTICSYSCSQAGHLKRHMLTHTGQRPFKCTSCCYSCSQASNLKRHLTSHSADTPFHCHHCSFKCALIKGLSLHILRRHGGRRAYGCAHCQYRAVTETDLVKHLSNKHR